MKKLCIFLFIYFYYILNLSAQLNYVALIEGCEISDSLKFFTSEVFTKNSREIDILNLIKKQNINLILIASPYLCGGLEKIDITFINELAEIFPKQIYLVISDFYLEDTKKALKNTSLHKNIHILFDKDQENFKKFALIDKRLIPAAYIIVNSNNYVQFLLIRSKDVDMTFEKKNELKDTLIKYLKKE